MAGELLKSEDKEIGGKVYRLQMLPAKAGRQMLIRLLKLAGPSVSAALAGLTGENMSLNGLTPAAIGAAILELTKALSEEDFEHICGVFLGCTQVHNEVGLVPVNTFNGFSGDYGSLLLLLRAHVELNYSSFFGALGITSPHA